MDTEGLLAPFFARLMRHGPLSGACRQQLARSAGIPRKLAKHERLRLETVSTPNFFILAAGLTLSSRTLGSGEQQHVALQGPGEVLDHEGYVLGCGGVSVLALTEGCVVGLPRADMATAVDQHPRLLSLLHRELAYNARIAQEWMANIGRRSALARTAHLLCEVSIRRDAVRESDHQYVFPLTQGVLADLLGLSAVHVNRVLQQLRQMGLVELQRGLLHILDREGLVREAQFDPAYLHVAQAD